MGTRDGRRVKRIISLFSSHTYICVRNVSTKIVGMRGYGIGLEKNNEEIKQEWRLEKSLN